MSDDLDDDLDDEGYLEAHDPDGSLRRERLLLKREVAALTHEQLEKEVERIIANWPKEMAAREREERAKNNAIRIAKAQAEGAKASARIRREKGAARDKAIARVAEEILAVRSVSSQRQLAALVTERLPGLSENTVRVRLRKLGIG